MNWHLRKLRGTPQYADANESVLPNDAALVMSRIARAVKTVVGAVVLASSCQGATAPPFPDGAVPLPTQAQFDLWWSMTQSCSGLTGDLAEVHWFSLPGVSQFEVSGAPVHGFWWSDGNRIVLAEESITRGPLVRHEMLHALSRDPGHSRTLYAGRCGGIVACDGHCAEEIGASPVTPEDAPILAPTDLDVTLHVIPEGPSQSANGGWFALVVSVQSPLSTSAWIDLTPVRAGEPNSATFGYAAERADEYLWIAGTRIGFAPSETKRHTFDLHVGQSWSVGEHTVRAFFNSDSTDAEIIRILP